MWRAVTLSLLAVARAADDDDNLRSPSLEEREHAADGAGTLCDPVKQYSGYFKLYPGKPGAAKNYFYWFFESRNSPSTDPVTLWMTGGPGCSSEVALFGENGPCSVNAGGNATIHNPYSWNAKSNLLYIDQPTGTGFSYGLGLDHDEEQVGNDMYDFLQQFFKAHPEYQKNDFYAFGESYAGHYVPATTHQIWQNNQNLTPGAVHINLKGTSVGNGLTDPIIQYQYYPEMIVSTNGHKPAVGKTEYDLMKAAVDPCVAAIAACDVAPESCIVATDLCNLGLMIPYTLTGMNPYDMREKCEKPPLCYDFSNVATFLERPEVVKTLGVEGHKWSDCNHVVALPFELLGDWMHSYQQKLPDQLASGIRVLMYAGDQDYICNWLGNQAWTKALAWSGKTEFNNAMVQNYTRTTTSNHNVTIGELRTAQGFSFLRVFNAGHMVPRDQPAAAQAMMEAFISGEL